MDHLGWLTINGAGDTDGEGMDAVGLGDKSQAALGPFELFRVSCVPFLSKSSKILMK